MPPELKTKSDISIVLIFFTALAIFGVAGGGFVVTDYARARSSLSWPAVEGIVLSRLDGETAPRRYVYSYDGRSYETTRRRNFMGLFLPAPHAELRPGQPVTVYVNPAEPDYAVLYPGGAGAAFVVLSLLAGCAVFFGVGGVVWALSRASVRQLSFAKEAV